MATYYWVGGNGTWDNATKTNWATVSGGAGGNGPPTNADTVNFDANSGTAAVVTVAATAVSLSTTVNKSDINLSLSGSPTLCTAAGTLVLTAGTITLNSYTLTCGIFSSSNSNARTIDFGTGQITLTGNAATVWNINTATGLVTSGTKKVVSSYSGATGTRILYMVGAETVVVDFFVTSGTDTVQLIAGGGAAYRTVDYTGFSGTATSSSASNINIFGDLLISSGCTWNTTAQFTFAATSGTKQITTNGKTVGQNVIFNGVGGTWQLQDNFTSNTTNFVTFTNGTLDLSLGKTLTCGTFASTNSNSRSILFGSSGAITVKGSGTVWNTATPTNFSYTGTSTINISNNSATAATVSTGAMTAAQALNFNYTVGTYVLTDSNAVYNSVSFTGFTGTVPNSTRTIYGNLTLAAGATNSAGTNVTTFATTSGTQQITTNGVTTDYPLTFNGIGGTFAFQDALTQGSTRAFTITNGTVQLKNGVTSTVGALATSGTNQKVLQSTSAGSQATLSQASGNFNAQYLTVKDIAATGGAKFNALNNCITQGNNSGWYFAPQLGRPLPAFAF